MPNTICQEELVQTLDSEMVGFCSSHRTDLAAAAAAAADGAR